MKSRAYRATEIKKVDCDGVFARHAGEECCVGLDVGKDDVLAVVRWRDGTWERPWRVKNPGEVLLLASGLSRVGQGRRLIAALEPSGTYGDALRQALGDCGVEVHRVSTKQSHDYAEIFDGVPSQHDAKDAAVVAELAAIGKSSPWPYRTPSEQDQEMAYWVDWMDAHRCERCMWCGRLEGLLARHWPEATAILGLASATLLAALAHYGGPRPLAEDGQAAVRLRGWGGHFLREETIRKLICSAAGTAGVRQAKQDLQRMASYADKAQAAEQEIQAARRALERLGRNNPVVLAQASIVGIATACVLWVHLGDPHEYSCGAAYRKAMGLNLKERSSGRWKGVLKITKRGHGQVRRWLYFSALRWCREPEVRLWYETKKRKDGGDPQPALTAIMRRLALALYQVGAKEAEFDATRLFPGCPLPPPHAAPA